MKRLRQASNVHVEILHRNDHSSSPIVVYDQIQQFKKEYNIDDSTHLVSPLHSLRAPLFSLRSGVSVLWVLDTLQPLSPFCAPLPALHRPSPSPEHNIKPGTSSRHDVVAQITAVLTSISATDTACRMRSRTSASSPHNAKSPCI